MTSQIRDSLSYITMTFLVFILFSVLMSTGYSTSANGDISFGWLQIRRHGQDWSVEHFSFGSLMLYVLIAFVLTWALSKVLRRKVK